MQDDVNQFMQAGGQPVRDTAFMPNNGEITFRMALIDEEYLELKKAIRYMYGAISRTRGNGKPVTQHECHAWVEVNDAITDLLYVLIGFQSTLGANTEAMWDEVHGSNMSKVVKGRLVKRDDGKVLKPDSYYPPNLHQFL